MKQMNQMTVAELARLVEGDSVNFPRGLDERIADVLPVLTAQPPGEDLLWVYTEQWKGTSPRIEVYAKREEAIDVFRRSIVDAIAKHPEVDWGSNRRRDDWMYMFDDYRVLFSVRSYDVDRRRGGPKHAKQ